MKADNILRDVASDRAAEIIETLVDTPSVRIERIVSLGQASPEDFWYDQPQEEWVLVLTGCGVIEFDEGEEVTMRTGDAVRIPAHKRHRVTWTSPDEPTVWLAVHFQTE